MPRQQVTAEPIASYLQAETEQYRLVSNGDAVERDVGGSVSTLAPTNGHGSALVVTTSRLLFVVGGGERAGEDALVSIPYADLRDATVTNGFLRSKVVIETTDEETYTLSPDDGEMDAVAEFLDRLCKKCDRVRTLLDKADMNSQSVDTAPETPVDAVESTTTESTLTRAHGVLQDIETEHDVDPGVLQERLETVWLQNYRERGDRLEARADELLGSDPELARRCLAAARDSYDEGFSIATDRSFDSAAELQARCDELAERVDELELSQWEWGGGD